MDIKPHKVKQWIHTPIADQEKFDEEVAQICNTYQQASELENDNIKIVSCDEKTGIQALEREITPMKKNHCERRDNSYERHGTQCLIANFDVSTGEVISPTIQDTRTEEDFKNHIEQTVKIDPDASWVFVVDQLNTHMSESLVLLVMMLCGLKGVDVGKKGKSGILKNMQTRKEFLSNQAHRIKFVYTPKHASWLNQVEIWFSILVKRLLKRLSVKSTKELKLRILDFIQYFNKTMAKPFKWTYKGRALKAT